MGEPANSQWLVAGKITGCYGIKGWVKIHPYTEAMENFLSFDSWQLKRQGRLEPVRFDAGKRHGRGLVAHIEGVDDRTEAEGYRGLEVLVPRAELPSLEAGDYYWHQLKGLEVWCTEGSSRALLGEVDYLIETGANDVLVIRPTAGSLDDRERLVPYVPGDVVTAVDLAASKIEINWFLDE
ncbi:MAG: ribosome maturation factor RimM [Pseudomonadota bacterium]